MLSKAQNKYIRSLTQQKYRKEHNVFIAEGDKICREWLNSSAKVNMIVALEPWADENRALINKHSEASLHIVTEQELETITALQTPNHVLLVVPVPEANTDLQTTEWCIALDDIQDPGNMGTIIRIADWFGINHIVCSENCVDVYNPKVVQSAMGGHLRVQTHTTDLGNYLSTVKVPVYAATLNGENIYNIKSSSPLVLLIGNESKGISPSLIALATKEITIPRIGGAESLNAGISTGILCALLKPA